MQNLFFITNQRWSNPEKRDSAIMRAYVPAHYMKQNFSSKINVDCCRSLPAHAGKGDIVIFVKDDLHTDILKSKSKGCITILDPCDMINFSKNGNVFDIIFSFGKKHSEWLSKNMSVDLAKIMVVEPLHTNINRLKANTRQNTTSPVIVGAVTYDKFAMLGEKNFFYLKDNIDNKGKISNINVSGKGFNFENNDVTNLHDCYKNIHIGLNLFDAKKETYTSDPETNRITIKPSVKLTAMASYDIPTISYYQSSYDKFIEKYKEFIDYIAIDIEDATKKINRLINDFEYYEISKKLFSKIGEDYHMNNSYEIYVNQINNFVITS